MAKFEIDDLKFIETPYTGARLTVPFTRLQNFGPKHHAIFIGLCDQGEAWIAELSRRFGHRLVSLTQWLSDNERFVDQIRIHQNTGPLSDQAVARNAIREVKNAREQYNLFFNNCENFADRNQIGKTEISPQVKNTLKVLGLVIAGGSIVLRRALSNR
ncbi:MAG: hypothetical protein AAGA30_19090, partial [Planctomycetota bacterium]